MREQSNLKPEIGLFANEVESIYGRSLITTNLNAALKLTAENVYSAQAILSIFAGYVETRR